MNPFGSFVAMVTKNATMHGGGGASHGEKQHGRIVQFLECPFVENDHFLIFIGARILFYALPTDTKFCSSVTG